VRPLGDPWGAAIGAEMTAGPVGLGLAGQDVSAWDDDSMDRGVAVDQLVELRSYALVPGQVEAFVEHFELHFLASQEELGMDVVGQFTVPGDDARFVWVRRFLEPSARGDALARFYGGPVWKEFGPRANELMVDHTDVHLLVPHRSAPAFAADHVPHAQRPDAYGSRRAEEPGAVVVAAVYELAGAAEPPAAAMSAARRAACGGGVTELGRLVTAGVPNDSPRLPVHEDVTVAVWLLSDRAAGEAATAAAEAVAASQDLALRTTRLMPTGRSSLR
jgi:NIPSNAP